jgi:4-amino-4-deoxychorismate lyase
VGRDRHGRRSSAVILVNGAPDTVVSAADRGLAYGDGAFRTLAVHAGQPRAWPLHYRKLRHDCTVLGIACPPEAILRAEIDCIARTVGDCAAKIIITRGAGERGYAPPLAGTPTRIVCGLPLPQYPDRYFTEGIEVRVCSIRLAAQPALAGIKHLNRLENVLARAEWTDPAVAEGLLCDAAGNVIGGTMSNLFMLEGGALVTPALTSCGVAGVTRERILNAARAHGMHVSIEAVDASRLTQADALLLTNSLIGVWQVARLGNRTWLPQAIVQHVRQWLDDTEA